MDFLGPGETRVYVQDLLEGLDCPAMERQTRENSELQLKRQ
jgi:hypothetical protein